MRSYLIQFVIGVYVCLNVVTHIDGAERFDKDPESSVPEEIQSLTGFSNFLERYLRTSDESLNEALLEYGVDMAPLETFLLESIRNMHQDLLQLIKENKISLFEIKELLNLDKSNDIPTSLRYSDCCDVLISGQTKNGVYTIYPDRSGGNRSADVFCDMETGGGGWTIFLSRMKQEEQINFTRNWASYKDGFGMPEGEYWLGNDNLHFLTSNHRNYAVRLEATVRNGIAIWGEWNTFKVGSEDDKYQLIASRFNPKSTAFNSLEIHSGKYFSTPEKDNDGLDHFNCAWAFKGGWWYGVHECYNINPTAIYGVQDSEGLKFHHWSKRNHNFRYADYVQMKLRPDNCKT